MAVNVLTECRRIVNYGYMRVIHLVTLMMKKTMMIPEVNASIGFLRS